ncbi:hypothetical protein [Streptomyces zingiberis]|uniref:hypothetical protein n=1 Tax=Streptomyces zingiberis TaxID=2053010 RepID=UPI001F1006DE|nr:hypothetical protein [Streptomyces zingiberis]
MCPARTDVLLHVTEPADGSGTAGATTVPGTGGPGDGAGDGPDRRRGYACLRNLEPPHPGDPGGGGGPRVITGDCVHLTRANEVRETSCEPSADPAPEFTVVKAVRDRDDCPAGTDLYVELGGGKPVGCARRL